MALLGVYSAVWMSLEGALWRVVIMGAGVTAVTLSHFLQKYGGGHIVSTRKWVMITAVTGLLFGLLSGPMTLIFMAVKTGLHAHGPEFTPDQITWAIHQIPIWTTVGFLAGLGLGLLMIKD